MKRIAMALALVGALGLGGCETDKSVLAGGGSLIAPIANPVQPATLAGAKVAYAGTLDLMVRWRDYCWSASYEQLMKNPVAAPLCRNRRPALRAMEDADFKTFAAISAAENFVRDNPTLSAVSLISAAMKAANDFKAKVPIVG